jgi:hypothetical protein
MGDLHETMAILAPLKDHVQALVPLAAGSVSLLSLVPQQEQTARVLQQLESDATSCLNNIAQAQSSTNALEVRVKEVEGWEPRMREAFEVSKCMNVSSERFCMV